VLAILQASILAINKDWHIRWGRFFCAEQRNAHHKNVQFSSWSTPGLAN